MVILEGFVYEWPRHFRGDFYNAMFGAWSGQGIYYGPVFVMERWLANAAPLVFNEYFFALLDIPFVVLAFVFAARAACLGWRLTAVVAAAWICYRWLTYAFSVAANPEIVELALLCVAWYLSTAHRTSLGLAATAAAVMTKRIPAIFVPLVLMTEPAKRSVVTGILVTAGIVMVVAVGQHMGPIDVIRETLKPAALPFSGQENVQEILAQPFPYPAQFLGLSNALARLFVRPMNDWTLPFFQGFYYVVTMAALGFATYLAFALIRGKYGTRRRQGETVSFAIFFALMPLAAITTHPHTFVFLLPTCTAVIALVVAEANVWRKRGLAALGGVCYLFIGFPAAAAPIDRYFGTAVALSVPFQDPIWANLLLVGGLFAYGISLLGRGRGVGGSEEPHVAGHTEIAT